MKRKRCLCVICVVIGLGAITPSYARMYRVAGPSDAPSFLVGDRILVNKAAYDVRLPYTDIVIVSHSETQRGDVVVFRPPGEEYSVFKRVIGCPGDRVTAHGGRVEVNGVLLEYEQVAGAEYERAAVENNLGAVIEQERGNGPPHLITHRGDAACEAAAVSGLLAKDEYFLVGDNRDNSRDSRAYGPVQRSAILGKVVGKYRPDP